MGRSTLPVRTSWRIVLALALGLPLLALGAVLQPAAALDPGPTGLAPDGAVSSAAPVFSWDPVTGASGYDVEVYDGATKLTYITNTVNHQWVPSAVQLPTGKTLTWRVRGKVGSVYTDWSQTTFTRAGINAPSLIGPINDQPLEQPGDPLVYDWTAVPGATSYTVEVSPDPDFVDTSLIKTYTTSASRLAPNIIPDDGTYYWHVTANLSSGLKSTRSANGSYVVTAVIRSGGQVAPTQLPVYPAMDQTIDDVVLDWNPIDGAAVYNVQVSTDSNFLTLVFSATNVRSTEISPPTTLDNDQYWWRIAPVNTDTFQTPWSASPVWRFTRRWPNQPTLLYPADGATVGNPFYYQWSPITLASSYELQVSTNQSFSPASTVDTCSTVHTTYTPSRGSGDCWPTDAGTYYWRVIAYDEASGVVSELVNADIHSFTYNAQPVTMIAPANGATIDIPTFSWQPYDNAAQYKVTVTPTAGGSSSTRTTATTTLTWSTKLTAGTYRWMVQPVFADGRIGAALLAAGQRTFTVQDPPAGTADSPEPVSSGPESQRPPLLTWSAVTNATSYRLLVRIHGSGGWTYLSGTFAYPSGGDTTGAKLSPGTYDWMVEAYNGGTFLSASTTPAAYAILPFAPVTGYRAALSGNDSGSSDPTKACAATLPSECQNLRQTPYLSWDPVPGASSYQLVIANDVNLTNPVRTVTILGTNVFMSELALPDANAGTAYFWDVRSCGPTGVCADQNPATHQFNKQGVKAVLTSPADGSTQPNDITFTWQDYLATLQADAGVSTTLSGAKAATEAKQYRIQVSAAANFGTLLDNKIVDQRSYTPWDRTYPEQQLFWRVQAIDGSGNDLPWSDTRTVTKSSPGPVLTHGIGGEVFAGSISLGWAPLAYARTYNVQVFPASVSDANLDTTTPLMQASGVKQNSWTPTTPLPVGSYKWRVRRADYENRFGQWSAVGAFTSAGSAPTLLTPANGVEVQARSAMFTWQPASDSDPVASYRIQLTPVAGTALSPVTTVATAYAPTTRLPDGSWTWTVTALDTEGQAIGTSSPRTFTVAGTLTASPPPHITGSGKVGAALTLDPVSWSQPGVTMTYQWYRGTATIAGATGSSYVLVTADYARDIKVKVTGKKPGFDDGTAFSNVITGTTGAALISINKPTYTGTRALGYTLTAYPGTWATPSSSVPSGTTYKYQWLRNGTAISGAIGKTYRVAAADAARYLSVRVTATATGYSPGTATSTSGVVAKLRSTTAIRLKASRIRRGTHGTVYVTVTAPLTPTGTIRIYDGSRLIKSAVLYTGNGGRKTVVLPLLGLGRHSIWVRYLGNGQINPSSSAHLVLTVTR